MQPNSGQLPPCTTPRSSVHGTYDVTVGMGDATATNSVYNLTANGTTVIDHVTPTSAALFTTATKRVTVTNGTLTLDPTGGTQDKLDFVDAVPAAADTIAPVA